jgi:hypothetical protein
MISFYDLAFPNSNTPPAPDLQSSIDKAITWSENTSPSLTLITVTDLQKHVLRYYDTVDDYLSAQGIKVTASFARLSDKAGYPIDPSNIT